MGPRLSKRQQGAVQQMLHRSPAWIAVPRESAEALERKGIVELRLTPQGWTECRLTAYGVECARAL